MNKRHLILLIVFATLASCTSSPTREAKRMIARAERLADTLPDSTACLIDSVLRMPVYFSERQRMDMALLQAEALFGCRDGARTVSNDSNNGISGDGACTVSTISPVMDDDFFDDKPFLSTSPDLERAAAYYARKKQYDKAAQAALYSGFVQQHYNEKEVAMRSFMEAEQYGGLIMDSLTVAQAQYKMGRLLYRDGMMQEAIVLLKAAEIGFKKQYAEKALTENLLAICYCMQGNYDSSEICLHQSLLNADNANSNKVKGKTLNNFAVLYRLQGKYDQALDCLRQAINKSDDSKLFLNYLNMGKIFVASGELDSALYYYQKIEDLLPTADVKNETKVSAYGALSQFTENQNDNTQALKYRKAHENLLYEVMRQRQEQAVFHIQKQYDYESLQNSLNRKIILRHRLILIISILLFIAAFIILILQYRHKQLIKAEAEMKMQIDAMKQDLRQTVKFSVIEKEMVSRLRMILAANRAAKRAKDPKNEWSSLMLQVMNGKDSLFDAARATIETAYPNLYDTIRDKYTDLTETETKVCVLSFSDLSNAEIAELLGLSLNTVNQNRSTLRKKLNLKPERMKEQLHNTLNN